MKIPVLFALMIGLAAASPAASQVSVPRIEIGSRVRVSVPARNNNRVVQGTDRWVTGTLIAMDSAELSLRVDGRGEDGVYTVPFDALDRLEVSRGARSKENAESKAMVQGGITGGGFALGALLFGRVIGGPLTEEEKEIDCPADCQVFVWTPGRALRNGAIGAAAGTLIGYAFAGRNKERWERIEHTRVSVIVGPSSLAFRLPLGN